MKRVTGRYPADEKIRDLCMEQTGALLVRYGRLCADTDIHRAGNQQSLNGAICAQMCAGRNAAKHRAAG